MAAAGLHTTRNEPTRDPNRNGPAGFPTTGNDATRKPNCVAPAVFAVADTEPTRARGAGLRAPELAQAAQGSLP